MSGPVAIKSRPFHRELIGNPFFQAAAVCALGGAVGVFSAFALYVTKPLYLALLIVSGLIFLPTLIIKNYRIYWLGIFLFTLQFEISKNLNDGIAIVEALGIDYTIYHFTFKVYATDLVFVLLFIFWINDALFHGKGIKVPRVTWLIFGYFLFCFMSMFNAPSDYLAAVEIVRQLKFFAFFIYAVNNITTWRAVRLIAAVSIMILVIQAGVTITRYTTGYLEPISFGQSYAEESEVEQYLAVDRLDPNSAIRGFGTLTAPGSTLRLCMMILPFCLMLCVTSRILGDRRLYIALTLFGGIGLLFTFTRAYYITTAVQLATAFVMFRKHGFLTRIEVLSIVVSGIVAVAVISPKLYYHFTQVRTDSVTVRLKQYEAALNMISAHPLLGVGLNNGTGVKADYVNVSYNEYNPESQFYLEPTHNLYLSLASEIGIIGALLFFTFFGYFALQAYRYSTTLKTPEMRMLASALVVMYAGVAVNALFDPLHEYPVLALLWLLSGVVMNLEKIEASRQLRINQ